MLKEEKKDLCMTESHVDKIKQLSSILKNLMNNAFTYSIVMDRDTNIIYNKIEICSFIIGNNSDKNYLWFFNRTLSKL